MPLNQLSLAANLTASMSRSNFGFAPTNCGPSILQFSLGGISLSNWNQLFESVYTLFTSAPSGLTATLMPGGSLSNGQAYYYKVTAVGYNGFGGSNETSGSNEVTQTASSENGTINLSWTALSQAVSYNVYRGTASGSENLLIGNTSGTTFADNGTLTGPSQSPPASMPADYVEFALNSFATLANETATPGHVLGIVILPTGVAGSSQCKLAPGSANGLTWFFNDTTGIMIPVNGAFLLTGPPSGSSGQAISGSSNTLRVTNAGTAGTTVSVAVITGP